MTSRLGYLILCLRAGIWLCSAGKTVANQEKKRQKLATKPNWISVRVAGFGKAIRIDFEEVFVRALEKYQMMQRIYILLADIYLCSWGSHTINLGDTGAFNAPPISCTFALILPLLVRNVLKASLKLFCLPCPPPVLACPFAQADPLNVLSLLGCQRSAGAEPFIAPFE